MAVDNINLDGMEIIDNEVQEIEDKLEALEDKQALGILKEIDAKISNYDIDLAKDGKNYYFIANYEKLNQAGLNIPLQGDQIKKIGDFLVLLLNNIDEVELDYDFNEYADIEMDGEGWMYLWGFLNKSVIFTEDMLKIFGLKNIQNDRFKANNKIRALFAFIQTIRNKKGS